MKKLIHYFIIIASLTLAISSCTNKKAAEVVPPEEVNTMENVDAFILTDWLANHTQQAEMTESKSEVITQAFNAFEGRISNHVAEHIKFSKKCFTNKEKLEELLNTIMVGDASLKSLEQLFNIRIGLYNDENPYARMNRISLHNIDDTEILNKDAIKLIKEKYKLLDNSAMKKKVKEQELEIFVKNIILRNYCYALKHQDLFGQL